ncbi:hypothetical protein QTA57_06670 [Fontisubflavum oceani]|uniref:hypothetical protein n=1 Tax=Fontisubflavum oceani TaxID=2978973 RepID=UPI0025B47E76|nr:hypothetical protein [Fontisubflavum oceani]WJY22771.1 hypothetical protein QTA57_06670 [Fontisubflavum oceani]
MKSALSLQHMVQIMDRALMPDASHLVLTPVCLDIEADVGTMDMDQEEARQIMAEIDAKSSALLAVLAIILATSAFIFSLDQRWLTLLLMFGQIVSISISILFLLRCLIYEPSPRLRHVFEMSQVAADFHLQIEAIKQVRYFNRVIVLTVITCVLFFVMSMIVGIDAMM